MVKSPISRQKSRENREHGRNMCYCMLTLTRNFRVMFFVVKVEFFTHAVQIILFFTFDSMNIRLKCG